MIVQKCTDRPEGKASLAVQEKTLSDDGVKSSRDTHHQGAGL